MNTRNKKWMVMGAAALIGVIVLIFIFVPQRTPVAHVGDIIEFGGYNWVVLDVDRNHALVITENAIMIGEGGYNDFTGGITWNGSYTRKHLNETFYYRFDTADRARIRETYVINNDSPWFHSRGGDNTRDKIFILSVEEVVQYFGDSGQLENRPEDVRWISDEYDSARIAWNDNGDRAWWWLRSPGGAQRLVTGVDPAGVLNLYGTSALNAGHIRPVMWLNLA